MRVPTTTPHRGHRTMHAALAATEENVPRRQEADRQAVEFFGSFATVRIVVWSIMGFVCLRFKAPSAMLT